jgi:hypothetical protein
MGVYSETPDWTSEPQNQTYRVAVGDVDGDKDLDLVFGNRPGITVYRNDRGSILTSPDPSPGPDVSVMDMVLGDVDCDGDLDIVCRGEWLPQARRGTHVFKNNGSAFASMPAWSHDLRGNLALGDVNGDRYPDLLFTQHGNEPTKLYLNRGGVFDTVAVWTELTVGRSPSVALGDVDGDGDPDLAIGHDFSTATVYLNDGDIFSKDPIWSSGPVLDTESLAFGDLDGDGDLDLMCMNNEDYALYWNRGGTLEKWPEWFRPEPVPFSSFFEMGDVDADGDLDIMYSRAYGHELYLVNKRPAFKGDPADPANQLPNNAAHLRGLMVYEPDARIRRIRFTALDVENDPLWIVPEYQFAGAPTWFPVEVDGQTGKVGPFLSSPVGTVDSLDWDISGIPYDNRNVILRFRVVEIPRRVSQIQQVTAYLKELDPIPSIAAQARPSEGSDFFDSRDVIVELSLPMGATPDQARLFFRQGGRSAYNEAIFEEGNPLPRATIPAEWSGARGLEYWVEFQTPTGRLTDPRTNPSDNPRTIRITLTNLEEDHGHAGERYRLMSVPLDLEGSLSMIRAMEDDIGFPDPLRWRMFAHDVLDSMYVEIPNDSVSSFGPGRGYWLITRGSHRLDTGPVIGTSIPTDSAFVITLEPGYNLVGHTFAFPVMWDSMTVGTLAMARAEGTIVESAVAWVGNGYDYSVDAFEPWEGYWVKNLTDSPVVLRVPPAESTGSAHSASPMVVAGSPTPDDAENEWTVGISATSMGEGDRYNVVGMRSDASGEWDKRDRSEAPLSPGRSVSLYFPHPTWEQHPGSYTVDMRGVQATATETLASPLSPDGDFDGQVWRFDVAKTFFDETAGDEVVLEFSGVMDLPSEAEILLVDRHLERVIDLRETDRYAFFQGERSVVAREEDARFVLMVGSEAFVVSREDELPKLPKTTVLHQNHPNPFNPSTVIRYDLARSGSVTLRIYNVNGALVKVLEDRERPAGRYEIGWGGDNQRGETVSSGVYFYHLKAGSTTLTRKMVLLK